MTPLEGQIELFLHSDGRGRVTNARLCSSRPVTACQVLIGKTASEVPRIVSLLYSVCGHAQTLAALKACESASEIHVSEPAAISRECLLLIETMREHAWRFLVDWPTLMGATPAIKTFQSLQQVLTKLTKNLCPEGACWRLVEEDTSFEPNKIILLLDHLEQLLKHTMVDDQEPPATDWTSWPSRGAMAWLIEIIEAHSLQALGISDLGMLPSVALAELDAPLRRDDSGEFVAQPCWKGHVYETGPVVRMAFHPVIARLTQRYGRGLLVRIMARLLELLELPARLRKRLLGEIPTEGVETLSPEPGIGLSSIETARGRLIHRVELDSEQVKRYQVLAPTEWNFHPEGPLVHGLVGLAADNTEILKQRAGMAIMALDPCVGYQIRVD